MIIKQVEQSPNIYQTLNVFPNQFIPEEEKLSSTVWIKNTLDYFSFRGYHQYKFNRDTFAENYNLLKGIINWNHFYERNPQMRDFMSQIEQQSPLPEYVKHYPILNGPLNTMLGELTKRPDGHRVRAFDDDSKAEELDYKTQLVQQYIWQQARAQIMRQYGGQDLPDDQLQQLTEQKLQDELDSYTSLAERWANHVITCMKPELQLKDKSEEGFRDLLTCSREFFHIYEDNSKRGFRVEVANPKNVFHSPTNDKKYSDTWYYGGTLEVMEISEIIEKIPGLSKEDIDHLTTQQQSEWYLSPTKSNFHTDKTGIDTIKYDTYNRYLEQERAFMEAELGEEPNDSGFAAMLNTPLTTSPLSYRYSVMRIYWISKKLVGKLTYVDQDGDEQIVMVDESYQEGSPGELNIEWGWINQWYQGTKIGTEVYLLRPFSLLDYCPVVGVVHEIKNTQARSLVDLMKPYQAIYNVCMNQLWRLLEKEIGNVYNISIRKVPTPKEGDAQDAIDIWENEARERGIIFEDDSPENMKAPSGNTSLSRPIDLTRTNEIKSRYELAQMIKTECWELVGMNKQRMGGVAATETATGTQTALTQSFAQTEPYFAQHEYVVDMLYQAILDATQSVESQKPVSTLSYITGDGENAFIQVTAPDIKLRDLHVFSTHSSEDQRLFSEIRQLAQPMLQNGASPYDIIALYSTNSIRQMKQVFKKLKDLQEQMAQTQQQQQQQQIDQEQQQHEQLLQEEARQKELDRINENMNKEKDRQNHVDVAIVQAMAKNGQGAADINSDGVPDLYQVRELSLKGEELAHKHDVEMGKLALEKQKIQQAGSQHKDNMKHEQQKLKMEEKKMQSDRELKKMDIRAKKVQKPKK